MVTPSGVQRAVEVAIHNDWFECGSLVVWDCLESPFGTKLEVYPAASAVGGFCATIRDRVGNGSCVGSYPTREAAASACLDHYLNVVNVGI